MPNTVFKEMSNYSNNNSSSVQIETICNEYIIPVICGFGIVCNILNIAVLSQRQMKESPYSYLMGLSVADLSVLTLSFLKSVFSSRFGQNGYAWKYYDAFVFLPIANIFTNSSVWITILLTLERWVSVRFPLKAKDICTRSLARRAMCIVFILSTICNVPRFMCQVVVPGDEDGTFVIRRTEFEQSTFYVGVTWFYICTIHIIPCILLVSLNACLIFLVYRANQRRNILRETCYTHVENNNHTNKEQMRLTVTCISIIFLFLICIIPSAFSNLPVAYLLFGNNMDVEEFLKQPLYRVLRVVTNMLVFLNLSLNFVLYCMFNDKFIHSLKQLLRYWLKRLLRDEEQLQRRTSRRSSSSSACYVSRGNGVYGYKSHMRSAKPLYTPCQAMYFHIEAYPLSNMSYSMGRAGVNGNKRQRFELSSQTEMSDTI